MKKKKKKKKAIRPSMPNRELGPQEIAQIVADLADKHGIWERDVPRFPELLRHTGVDADDITPGIVVRARRINQEAFEALCAKYGANRKPQRPKNPKDNAKETRSRTKLFGFPVTAVIRWMGLDAWSFEEAKQALETLKMDVADATIRAQLRAGRKGERGEPAKLSKDQRTQLYGAIKN